MSFLNNINRDILFSSCPHCNNPYMRQIYETYRYSINWMDCIACKFSIKLENNDINLFYNIRLPFDEIEINKDGIFFFNQNGLIKEIKTTIANIITFKQDIVDKYRLLI